MSSVLFAVHPFRVADIASEKKDEKKLGYIAMWHGNIMFLRVSASTTVEAFAKDTLWSICDKGFKLNIIVNKFLAYVLQDIIRSEVISLQAI